MMEALLFTVQAVTVIALAVFWPPAVYLAMKRHDYPHAAAEAALLMIVLVALIVFDIVP